MFPPVHVYGTCVKDTFKDTFPELIGDGPGTPWRPQTRPVVPVANLNVRPLFGSGNESCNYLDAALLHEFKSDN